MKKILTIFCLAILFCSSVTAAEVTVKFQTWTWQLSIISSENISDDNCSLMLVGEHGQIKKEISLKHTGYNCSLFGPLQLLAFDTENRKTTYVFFEATRGGDGDHTGPIVEIYSLTGDGFSKLGEQELFEASYHRKGQEITSVTGKILFTFCQQCDGPEASPLEDSIYVPVIVTIGCSGICVKPTIDTKERKIILKKFNNRKAKAVEDYSISKEHRKYIEYLEKTLNELLNKR